MTSTGQVESGGRTVRIELRVAADGIRCREGLDFDTSTSKLLERLGIGAHLPVRAGAYDEVLREVFSDIVEVLQDKSVAIYPPPICDHSLREHDHIACLLFPINDEAAEAVALERRHSCLPQRLWNRAYAEPGD